MKRNSKNNLKGDKMNETQYYKAETTREGMAYYPVEMPQEFSESIQQAEQEERERVKGGVDDIQYNSEAEGCGLEDLGITDRYHAMEYGWEQCKKAVTDLLSSLQKEIR